MHKAQDKPANAANVLKFFDWAYANGDKMADDLDYVPLPALGEGRWCASPGARSRTRRASRSPASKRRGAVRPSAAQRYPERPWPLHFPPAPYDGRKTWRVRRARPRRPAARRAAPWADALFAALAHGAALADAGAARRHPRLAASSARRRRSANSASASSGRSDWDPVQDQLRRPGDDLRHADDVAHRAADRRAGELRHRAVPHRAVAALAQAPARHRDRAARRGALDRLRHVGPARVRPDPVALTCSSRCRRLFDGVPLLGALFSGPPVGHRHAVGRASSWRSWSFRSSPR